MNKTETVKVKGRSVGATTMEDEPTKEYHTGHPTNLKLPNDRKELAQAVEKAAKQIADDIDKKKRKRENKLKKMQHQVLAASRKLSRQRKKRNRLKKQHRF